MPLIFDHDYREGPALDGFSNLCGRIKSHLLQSHRCTLLSRHNTLALQSEKFLALPGAAVRPVLDVRILESALTRRTADPASEIRLLEHATDQLCLSFPSRLVEGWKTEPQAGQRGLW